VPAVPSLALGSGEVTLLTLTSAFAVFANDGMLMKPILIKRVTTRDGTVLFNAEPEGRRALRSSTAYLMTSMLEGVINAGTAARARGLGFRLPAAGKTGTTNDYHDAWFVGYTPHLATGVWVGYDRPRTIVNGGYAAELAVPLWARFMIDATKSEKPVRFQAPKAITTVEICRLTGNRATESCRRDGTVYAEHFEHGTEPEGTCLHRGSGRPVLFAAAGAPSISMSGSAVTTAAPSGADEAVKASQPSPASEDVAAASSAAPEPTQKKRGFWSRLFGRGRDAGQDKD
jgi:membrane carboxypeptidase/penicillin-binding protein